MCPQEKNAKGENTQARSYISTEPAMMRALESNFSVKGQFLDRIETYIHNGIIDKQATDGCEKVEVIVSGGTWDSYPRKDREQAILEIYWAANTLFESRPIGTLEQEKLENETARFRIVGLTLETRPDKIKPAAILDYLRWGVTRMQIGVQHFDDGVLKKINRKCYLEHTVRAIALLKQAGFKVVVHLMPDLPGSTPVV
jgi:histone acetyltransferase (RNA polymerase elongator complex component)